MKNKLGLAYIAAILTFIFLLLSHRAEAVPNLNESGVIYLQQNGYATVAASGLEVWSGNTAYNFLDATSSLMAQASSAQDGPSGTGCPTILVEGLDGSWLTISETVTLAGNTRVALANTYRRINKVSCASVGTGGVNAGLIGITGVSSTSNLYYAQIPASQGISQQAVYSVSNDKHGTYLEGWDFSCGASSTCQIAVSMQMREFGGSWKTLSTANGNDSSGIIKKLFGNWLYLPPKADIRLKVESIGSSGYRVNGGMEVIQKP